MFNGQENPVWKKVYYIFSFLKVNQCKFKQKESILKLGNPLKSKSKFTKSKIGWGALHWTHWGPSDSRSIILKSHPIKMCRENTDSMYKMARASVPSGTILAVHLQTFFAFIKRNKSDAKKFMIYFLTFTGKISKTLICNTMYLLRKI